MDKIFKNPLFELCEKENMQLGGGGGVEGLWKINTSYSQIKPISDKKKVGPFWPKKLGRFGLGRFGFGPFCPGPFWIWAVLTIILIKDTCNKGFINIFIVINRPQWWKMRSKFWVYKISPFSRSEKGEIFPLWKWHAWWRIRGNSGVPVGVVGSSDLASSVPYWLILDAVYITPQNHGETTNAWHLLRILFSLCQIQRSNYFGLHTRCKKKKKKKIACNGSPSQFFKE